MSLAEQNYYSTKPNYSIKLAKATTIKIKNVISVTPNTTNANRLSAFRGGHFRNDSVG